MTYTPYYPAGWRDSPNTATPIIAAALQNMEDGIGAAIPAVQAGAADGVATLDGSTRLPTAELPTVLTAAGVQGATGQSRLVGSTTLGAPSSGTWQVCDAATDAAGNIWVCTTAGTPGSWMQVVPSPPEWFYPENYGAKGDGRLLTDGAMTASGNVLTSASAGFTSADTGKYFLVWNALTGTYLFARGTYVSATQMQLSVSATNTVSATGFFYATDDTSAWQQAINAAQAWTLEGNGKPGRVVGKSKMYGIASPAITGGSTAGNMQLYLAPVPANSGPKAQVEIFGTGPAQLPHWLQVQPPQSGTILVGMRTDGSLDVNNGPSTVIGGPIFNYGSNQVFSNMHLRVRGLTVMVPTAANAYGGIDLYGVGQASIDSFSYLPLGVVPSGTAWPQLSAVFGSQLPGYTVGLRGPAAGNNAVFDIGEYTCYFAQVALVANEHCTCRSLKTIYDGFGLLPTNSAGGSVNHGIHVMYWTCENTPTPIGSLASGYFSLGNPISVTVDHLSLETYSNIVSDLAGNLYGQAVFDTTAGLPGHYFSSSQYANSKMGVKLIHATAAAGPVASPQGAPNSTNPWLNGYYRDAEITLSVSGGTISALEVDSVAETLPASCTVYKFTVPAGHSYTPTFTGTLSHTVKLL